MHHVSPQFMEFFLTVIFMAVGAIALYSKVIKPRFESDGVDTHPAPHGAEASGRSAGPDHPEAH